MESMVKEKVIVFMQDKSAFTSAQHGFFTRKIVSYEFARIS